MNLNLIKLNRLNKNLHAAIEYKSVEDVAHYLKAGADVNALHNKPRRLSALQMAVITGDVEKVNCLLQYKPDIKLCDANGWTALLYACNYGFNEIVHALLDYGANPNHISNHNDGNSLFLAARAGLLPMVSMLIDAKADVNSVSGNNATSLHAATHYNNPDIVKLLLENGADVNLTTSRYGDGHIEQNALAIAKANKRTHVVTVLEEHLQCSSSQVNNDEVPAPTSKRRRKSYE